MIRRWILANEIIYHYSALLWSQEAVTAMYGRIHCLASLWQNGCHLVKNMNCLTNYLKVFLALLFFSGGRLFINETRNRTGYSAVVANKADKKEKIKTFIIKAMSCRHHIMWWENTSSAESFALSLFVKNQSNLPRNATFTSLSPSINTTGGRHWFIDGNPTARIRVWGCNRRSHSGCYRGCSWGSHKFINPWQNWCNPRITIRITWEAAWKQK